MERREDYVKGSGRALHAFNKNIQASLRRAALDRASAAPNYAPSMGRSLVLRDRGLNWRHGTIGRGATQFLFIFYVISNNFIEHILHLVMFDTIKTRNPRDSESTTASIKRSR